MEPSLWDFIPCSVSTRLDTQIQKLQKDKFHATKGMEQDSFIQKILLQELLFLDVSKYLKLQGHYIFTFKHGSFWNFIPQKVFLLFQEKKI